jgi:hypothetical protein
MIWNHRGVRSGSGLLGEVSSLSASVRGVLLAAVVGFAVLIAAGLFGDALFAGPEVAERVVAAKVVEPSSCTEPDATEKVTFTDGGKKREATLSACGHEKGESLRVAVPTEAGPGGLTVRSAESHTGLDGARRSIGLGLMGLACAGGGFYAWLVTRAQRPVKVS